jgi:hypothetical protein
MEETLRSFDHPSLSQIHSMDTQPKPPWWDCAEADLLDEVAVAGSSVGYALVRMASRKVQNLDRDPRTHRAQDHQAIHWLLQQFSMWMNTFALSDDTELRRTWITIDLFNSVIRGMLADGLIYSGFDGIDNYEFREWLRKHGVSDLTLNSAWLRAGYDLAFSFANGHSELPNIAAGACLRGLLRLVFGYKGAPFWKMQAGMGETVFAPLYQVLKDRGVQFRFFHKVQALKLSDDKTRVGEIRIARQATLVSGKQDYDPLVEVGGLPCWPMQPLYDQLQQGADLNRGGYNLESYWTDWANVDTISSRKGKIST